MVYSIGKIILAKPAAVLWLNNISGIEHLPKHGKYVIAANHISVIDGFLLSCIVTIHRNKKLHFYVNSKYFENKLLKTFLDYGGCIPVFVGDKKNTVLNQVAHTTALDCLDKEEPIGIFPEGRIRLEGVPRKPRHGLARLVHSTGATVIPVGIVARKKIVGSKKICSTVKGYDIRIGKPLHFSNSENAKQEEVIEHITKTVMDHIENLLK